MPAVPTEALVIGTDQVRLAHRRRGLELRQVVRASRQIELAQAGTHGPGAHQRHLAAGRHDRTELLGEMADSLAGSSWPLLSVSTLVPTLTTQVRAESTTSSRTRSRTIAIESSLYRE